MKKVWIAAVLAALSMASTAQAADMYAGVGLGAFEMDAGANKKTSFGGFGFVGANLHEYAAAELRVGSAASTDNADFAPAIERAKVDWFFSALVKPKIEVADGLTLYGLAGFTTSKASFTGVVGAKAGIKQSKTNTDFSFGMGGEYNVMPQLAVGGEWVRYSSKANLATKNTRFEGLDINGFAATVRYSF